jgi:catechol-2,3-dioxygenase
MNEKRRLHIHMSVDNIEESIAFYTIQFGTEATKVKDDYAQWNEDACLVRAQMNLLLIAF